MELSIKSVLTLGLVMTASWSLQAQEEYEPKSTWPYLYETFSEGSVQTLAHGGSTVNHEQLNISVIDGCLHYVNEGKIMAINMTDVKSVAIGSDRYLNAGGSLGRVLRETPNGAVIEFSQVDTEELAKVDVGYGKSSLTTAVTVSLQAYYGKGILDKDLYVAETGKSGGIVLPVKSVKRLFFDGMVVKATKYDVFRIEGIDKAGLRSFLKDNKTKFSSDDDLAALVEWLHENLK